MLRNKVTKLLVVWFGGIVKVTMFRVKYSIFLI